jgi:GrpB-like predicted nucleotidyltransferase (UPF0157 family)
MMERGVRDSAPVAQRLMKVYGLPPTVLPVDEIRDEASAERLAQELARLGYPGYAHLRKRGRAINPASFLLTALGQRNLEARTAEGLPWVVLRYPDMDINFIVREARARNLQNRLGFVVTLARRAADRSDLDALEQSLADSKLEKQDSFCKDLNDSERRWLKEHSSVEAREWNLLSDLTPDVIRYA